jgi:hypothetical protein
MRVNLLRSANEVPVIVLVMTAAALGWISSRDVPLPPGDRLSAGEADSIQAEFDQLDAKDRAAMGRIEAKERILDEVMAGRVQLLAAAAQFRKLGANSSYYWPALRRHYEGSSDEERVCRNMIDYLRKSRGVADGDPADQMRAVLEAELRRHLEEGTLHLPE